MLYNLLLCLGDSLTSGARDEFGRNYPLELARLLSTATGEEWYCITEAANGRTSSELARDIYTIAARYPDTHGAIILVGTNDSRLCIPDDIYEDNIRQVVRVCRILGKRPFLLSIPYLSYERHFLWYDEHAFNRIASYNRILRNLVGVRLIDLDTVITNEDLIDGVHLSHSGNIKLARVIAETLLGRKLP